MWRTVESRVEIPHRLLQKQDLRLCRFLALGPSTRAKI